MAEANLIPGATQVFADVLEGGSVEKLFDNMQKGKYDLQDIVRVLDSLESKLKKDLLTKMFDKPSVAMNDFRTALTRFWEEVNSSGGTDLLIGGLTAMADALKGATKWISENKETVDSWVKGIKIVGKVLWELVPALLAIWGMKKVFKLMDYFHVEGNAAAFGGKIGKFLLSAFRIARLVTPWAALYLLFDDIWAALNGRESVLANMAATDDGLAGSISRVILGSFETAKMIIVRAGLSYDWLAALFTGDASRKKATEEAIKMWRSDMATTLEKYGFSPLVAYLKEELNRLTLLSSAITNALSFNFDAMDEDMAAFGRSVDLHGAVMTVDSYQESSAKQKKEENANRFRKHVPLPMLGATYPPISNQALPIPTLPSYQRPDPLGLSSWKQQPVVNIEVNATGVSAAELDKIVNDNFRNNLQSTLLGTIANHQGGK